MGILTAPPNPRPKIPLRPKPEVLDFNVCCDTDWDLIDDISKIRERNNKNWMGILKLAFQYAPKEAKKLMKQITENDAEINKLSKKLSENKNEL